MQNFEIKVGPLYIEKRIDIYLTETYAGRFSRQEMKAVLDGGRVSLNGKVAKPRLRVKEGDVISGVLPEDKPRGLGGESIPLNVLYEDTSLMVVDKPAGMVVHPGTGNKKGTLAQALLGRGGEWSDVGGPSRPGIVHRLDKDTSGLIIVAKNNQVHRLIQSQFVSRSLSKIYTALVKGHVEFQEGHIDLPIGRDPRVRQKMAVVIRGDTGREAMTHYRVLKRYRHATLLEVKIVTGRTHQIRVHMAHLGHPVVGDALYGERPGGVRLALHASKIEFAHPKNGKIMKFESPLPPDMKDIIEKAAAA